MDFGEFFILGFRKSLNPCSHPSDFDMEKIFASKKLRAGVQSEATPQNQELQNHFSKPINSKLHRVNPPSLKRLNKKCNLPAARFLTSIRSLSISPATDQRRNRK